MGNPITTYIPIKSLYLMNPTKFVFDMLKRIEKRGKIQITKNINGQEIVTYGITDGEKKIIDLFKSGNLNPRAFSNLNEEINQCVTEGLSIPKRTILTKYFQNGKQINFENIDKTEDWEKREYNRNGRIIYINRSNGDWEKREYDQNGNQTYVERSDGFWEKYEYDVKGNMVYLYDYNDYWEKWEYGENGIDSYWSNSSGDWYKDKFDDDGQEIYYEDSNGNVRDNRPINEGLNIPKAQLPQYRSEPLSSLSSKSNPDVVAEFFNPTINLNIKNWGNNKVKIVRTENGWCLYNYDKILAFRSNYGYFHINVEKYSSSTSKIQGYIKYEIKNVDKNHVSYTNETGVYLVADTDNNSTLESKGFHDVSLWEIVEKVICNITEGLNIKKSNLRVLELSTDLLPILNVCMYGTTLDALNMVNPQDLSPTGNDKFWEYFDGDIYNTFVFETAKDMIHDIILPEILSLNLGIKDINVVKLVSPKSYNYGCDELYYDMSIYFDLESVLLKDIDKQDEEELENFLQNKFRSYDGFNSYMPTSIYKLKEMIINDSEIERGVSAYLTYKLQDKFEEWQNIFIENIYENNYYIQFLSEETPAEIIEKIHQDGNGEEVDWDEDELD